MEELHSTKITTIRARVTPEQKKLVKKKAEEAGFDTESEYVLSCCLKGEHATQSERKIAKLNQSDSKNIHIRVTPDEKKEMIEKFEKSQLSNFGRYVRLCCLDKQIIVIEDLKEFSKELHKVGNNLNQLTMLCHQGLIENPDLTETRDYLSKLYKELVQLNKKIRPGR